VELLHAAACKPPHEAWRATYERIHASKLEATTGAAASMEDGMQLRGEDTRECPTLIGDDNENPLVSPPETPTSPPRTTRKPSCGLRGEAIRVQPPRISSGKPSRDLRGEAVTVQPPRATQRVRFQGVERSFHDAKSGMERWRSHRHGSENVLRTEARLTQLEARPEVLYVYDTYSHSRAHVNRQ
jgi:hypothetical protein